MFSFLKDKIKSALSVFSKKVEKEVVEKPEEKKEELTEEIVEKKKESEKKEQKIEKKEETEKEEKRTKERKKTKQKKEQEIIQEIVKEKVEEKIEKKIEEKFEKKVEEKKEPVVEIKSGHVLEPPVEESKKGIFAKITEALTTRRISETKFNELFWELELLLLENNVAVEVIEKIKNDLKTNVVDKPLKRTNIEQQIAEILKNSVSELLTFEKQDLLSKIKNKKDKPYVVCFFGVNGSGKTTTIAKLASVLQKNGLQVVLAAGDTFRAAAIDQLTQHADNIGVKIIKYDYGADAAAVSFDAIKFAKSKNKDVVLIDTAGRQHSNQNLMDEMKKIVRVSNPDLKVYIGESITGNDCVEQATKFNEAIGIDGIILTKVDIDEKGGTALSVSYVTKKPILFLGMGQTYDDLKEFNKEDILKNLGLN